MSSSSNSVTVRPRACRFGFGFDVSGLVVVVVSDIAVGVTDSEMTGLHIFCEDIGGSGSPALRKIRRNKLTLSPALRIVSPFSLSRSFHKKFLTARV